MSHAGPARVVLGLALTAQAVLAGLNVWGAGPLFDLDGEFNVPTYFHSALLAAAALLALDVARLEARLLRGAGLARGWAVAWLGAAALLGYLALDESLAIHEGFYTAELRARLAPASPLQLALAWMLIFLPAIVAATAFLLASLGARARLSRPLVGWGGLGLGLWILALTLEGTAKPFFIPRNLYALEVILEETAESLGTTLLGWALWRYRAELGVWLKCPGAFPRFAVPWRWVWAGTLALALPAAVIAGAIALSPHALEKSLGDQHLRAGRLEDAARAYRTAVALAPDYVAAWNRLGIAEYRRGNLEAAEEAFAAAERLDPRSPHLSNHRGAVLFRQGRYAEAAEAFARAAVLAPADAEVHRNLGVALHRLGRKAEAEATLRRAEMLAPRRLAVTSLQVILPADLPLAYIANPWLETALDHTLAGRPRAAVREYRDALAAGKDLAPAHLGLANELLRWSVARRLTEGRPPTRVRDADLEGVRPSVRFTHWVRQPDGRWQDVTVAVEPGVPEGAVAAARREAREHYRRALSLGGGAAAHLGLALLAREEGRPAEAAFHLAEARTLDPGLPALDRAASLEYGDPGSASYR